MNISTYYDKFVLKRDKLVSPINNWANHLIIIFAFATPIIIPARRSSFFLVVALFVIRGGYLNYIKNALRDPVIFAFTLYFVVHAVWLVGTDDWSSARKTIHDAYFLLIPLLFSTFIDSRYVPRIIIAFLLGMFTSMLMSYGIFLDLLPAMPHNISQGTASDPSPVYHHSVYGFMLAVTAALLLQRLLIRQDSLGVRIFLFVFFVLLSVSIFLNTGRTGYVLYVVFLAALLILVYRRKMILPLVVLIAISSLAFFYAYNFSSTFKGRADMTINSIKSYVQEGDYHSSLGYRAAFFSYGVELAKNVWPTGVGTGDHTQEIKKTIQSHDPSLAESHVKEFQHPHNEFLSSIIQFGLVGFIIYLNILFQLFRYKNPVEGYEYTFRILSIGILLYTWVDVLVIGLGATLTIAVLVTAGLKDYQVKDAGFKRFNSRQALSYLGIIGLFQIIQLLGDVI